MRRHHKQNIIFSFICAFAGYLLYKNISSDGKYIGLIGLGFGVVGFVLTLVYVIESGLVFTDISVDDDYKDATLVIDMDVVGSGLVQMTLSDDDEDRDVVLVSAKVEAHTSDDKLITLKEWEGEKLLENGCVALFCGDERISGVDSVIVSLGFKDASYEKMEVWSTFSYYTD